MRKQPEVITVPWERRSTTNRARRKNQRLGKVRTYFVDAEVLHDDDFWRVRGWELLLLLFGEPE
jgi:hypothetical protein